MAKAKAIDPIKSVLDKKKLEDLKPADKSDPSNPIELTAEHVELITQLHQQGVERREIKRQVKHSGISTNAKGAKLGLTWQQLDTVLAAINTKIAELTPVEAEPVEE